MKRLIGRRLDGRRDGDVHKHIKFKSKSEHKAKHKGKHKLKQNKASFLSQKTLKAISYYLPASEHAHLTNA